MSPETRRSHPILVTTLLLLPALHPVLIPLVGVPSHLVWFVHVLPVALATWHGGRGRAFGVTAASAFLVVVGERLFGAGYGSPAEWETVASLTVAVTFTNLLVVGFALYARAASERYRLLFDRVKMAVLRVDAAGRIVAANPEAAEILGTGIRALRGRDVTRLIVEPAFDDVESMAECGTRNGRLQIAVGDAGMTLHAFLAVIPDPDGAGYQVLLADRSVEELQAREIERQSKLATLGEALAGVAHELSNPLTTIVGQAQIARMSDRIDPESREAFEVISGQAARMQELIGELLGFSRVEAGRDRTDLRELLERLVRVQEIALDRTVRLELDLRWEGTLPVNPTKVEQIVVNLVSNAAYVLREGGGGTIGIVCRADGEYAYVEVADDGPGIAPDLLERIFEPFMTTKPEGEGTGLGLAISRRLARTWGGDLVARNRPDGGALFVLKVPRSRTPARKSAGGRETVADAADLSPVA